MKIYLDFDGTVVEHQYPALGLPNEGCFEVLKKLQSAGHEIILNTYRANISKDALLLAIMYLNQNKIIHPIKNIAPKKIAPKPWNWDYFKKHDLIYIDDICEGIPLKPAKNAEYDIVDWKKLDKEFLGNGVY